MGRSRRGYGGYRGRKTANDMLKTIALVLGILVLLVLGGLLWGQKYIVFTDNGPRLDAPFQQKEEQKPLDGDVSVVVQPSGAQSEAENLPEPEPPVEEEPALAAMELPLDAILDGTAVQRLEEAGANGVIVEMKNQEGMLNWVSEQPFAAQAGVNSRQTGVNEALRQWNAGEVYTIARVCCFRDNSLPYQRNDVALRATYGNWRDELGLRWLNPDSEAARTYLAELCRELAELGFDEILLECCGFPTQGSLDSIVKNGSFASGQYAAATEAFLTQVSTVLEPYDTAVAIRVERASLAGEDVLSGLNAGVLESCADRLWMAEDGGTPGLLELLSSQGILEPERRLVKVLSAFSGEVQGDSAVLN